MATNAVETTGVTPRKVMIGGFAALAVLAWVGVQVFMYRALDPTAIVIGVVALAGVGLVASGKRWGLVAAMAIAAALVLFDLPIFLERFGRPEQVADFTVSLLALTCYVVILAAGTRALRHHRG